MFNIALPYIRRIGKGAYGHASISPTQALIKKLGGGGNTETHSVSGITPVMVAGAIAAKFKSIVQHGKVTQTGTPTAVDPVDLVCNNGALKWDSENQRIYADGTPEVLTVSADDVADQTATAENLLAVGNVRDEQDIINGKVIRRTEAFKYDGTQQIKPTFMSSTGGKDDGAIIVQPRGAEYAGDVVSFEAEEGKAIDSLIVTLTPKQEGTGDPSPDNVRPITGTEKCEVWRDGKNLFPYETVPAYAYAWYNGSKAMADATQPVLLKGGTNYILSAERDSEHATSTWLFLVRAWYTDGTILTADDLNVINLKMYGASYGYDYQATPQYFQSLQTTDGTPLTLAPTKDVVVDIRMQSNKGIGVNPMLEVGAEATTYAPFDPLSTTLEVKWGAVGKNLLNPSIDAWTVSNGYRWIKGVVPNNAVANMSLIEKDPSVDTTGIYIGFCRDDLSQITGAPSQYRWVVANGSVQPNKSNSSQFDGDPCGNVFIYPNTEETFNKIFGRYNIQVELGSSATTYEPYTKTIYGGHVDAVRGEIVLTMKSVDMGSLTWATPISANPDCYTARDLTSVMGDRIGAICSAYPVSQNASSSSAINNEPDKTLIINRGTGTTGNYPIGTIIVKDSAFASYTQAQVAEALSGVMLCYNLSTPITIPISPKTLTALRNNTVWSDAGPVDVLLNDELVEMVAKLPLRTDEGDNTVSVVSEVGNVDLDIVYRRPKE